MNEKDLKSLKESIDTLIDENERLRKRIKVLEAQKEPDVTNVFDEKVEKNVLEKLLREHKTDYDNYKPYYDDDWSYRPKRGTDGRPYWPYEVGDWPPGPQVGDVPPGTIPPGYPYWCIFPPYWPGPC